MASPTSNDDTPLDREEILRQRAAIAADLAAWREHMGSDVATWPDELREEYADLAQSWFWLGLLADGLDEADRLTTPGR